MIGQSTAFVRVLEFIKKIASCRATVLIEGETGTGKELAARAIHYQGDRRAYPFVPVNCGALPDTLLENELFGHARGAYTDAGTEQPGLVQLAEGGTLFLDEIDALTPRAQITLLRFLQDQQYRPLGGRMERHADVRVVAACNRPLSELVECGEFRTDLMYRLRLLNLRMPALREREGDALLLASHFVREAAQRFDGELIGLDVGSLDWFDSYEWPGNVRELENLVYQAYLLNEAKSIAIARPGVAGFDDGGGSMSPLVMNYREAKEQAITQFEQRYLTSVMQRTDGNVSAAARMIGTERRHLGRLLKKYGIGLPSTA
jgi:DNA-binding NtrC family response regulator